MQIAGRRGRHRQQPRCQQMLDFCDAFRSGGIARAYEVYNGDVGCLIRRRTDIVIGATKSPNLPALPFAIWVRFTLAVVPAGPAHRRTSGPVE